MVELFNIAGFSIYLLSVTSAIGILVGMKVMLREGKRKKLDQDNLLDMGFFTVLFGIIGARIGYILVFNPAYYLQNPIEIFSVHQGGLSIQGAISFAALFSFTYMKKKKMDTWKTADTFAPGIILGQAIGRVGCDVFGTPMARSWFWGITVNGELVHPVQLYEAILNYILFVIIWRKRKSIDYDGQLFVWYLLGFSINRFVVEIFRTNPMISGNLSVAHVFSLILIGTALLSRYKLKNKRSHSITFSNEQASVKHLHEKVMYYFVIATVVISIIFYYWVHTFFVAG